MGSYGVSTGLINGRYEIRETLWTGGMGNVYRVLDRQGGVEVALKIMEGDHPIPPPRLHRFKTEFRRTPGLVPDGAWEVYDTGLTEHGLFFMTLEVLPARQSAGKGAASALSGEARAEWQRLLAHPGVLEGAALKQVLDWITDQASADRGLLQVLDAEGHLADMAARGEAQRMLDASRPLIERVRYDRQLASLEEPGHLGWAWPLLADDQLQGVLYLGKPEGAVDTALVDELAADLGVVLAKDRQLRKAQEDRRHLEMLNALSRTISATMDFPQILKLVILQALEVTEAEQGAVFWGPECLAALDRQGSPLTDFKVSQSVINQVLEEARSLSILDTQEDERFATQASIMDLQLRSIMCVPLRAGQETRGVLYVSSQSVNRTFGPHDLEVLEAIGAQVALALETAASYQTIRELNLGLEEKVKARTAELASALSELQRAQAQLVQSEKMASLGQMVAGVAHELNNPLNFIHGNLKVMRQYLADLGALVALYDKKFEPDAEITRFKEDVDYEYMHDDLNKILDSCLKGATRSQKIVEDLKLFSGHDEADLKEVDLQTGLKSTVAMVEGRFEGRVTYHLELAELPALNAYGKQLNQVFLAVLTNASQAIAEQGEVFVGLSRAGEDAVVTIRDTGVGIDPEHLPKVFDPFFTTRPIGEGTGLGLTTAYSIVERHNGTLTLESEPGAGTTATIRLPLAGV